MTELAPELPSGEYAMRYGSVHQDDEDWFGINDGRPFVVDTPLMGEGSDAWRKLVKVR
jgi:hypothetical protein